MTCWYSGGYKLLSLHFNVRTVMRYIDLLVKYLLVPSVSRRFSRTHSLRFHNSFTEIISLPSSKSLLVGHLLAFANCYKILRVQRNMTTTTSAGIEPADFAECSHSMTMPAGMKPAGCFKKSCHEHIFATKKHSPISSFPSPHC